MSEPGRLRRLGLGLAFATMALDQLTKWWIVNFVMNPPSVIEVTPFFNLVLGLNRGVSFGMFSSDSNLSRWLLTALALAIVCALAVWLWRAEKPWLAVALGLIIGGFCLFLYSEHRIRECDKELWRQQQLHKSFMRHKDDSR